MKTKHCLKLDDAKKILAAAEAKARAEGVAVAITVLDDGGDLIAMLRLDGVTPAIAEIAVGTGRTSARSGQPTKFSEDLVRNGWAPILGMNFILPLRGALPIVIDGERVGGVGIAGASRELNEDIARAAIEALTL